MGFSCFGTAESVDVASSHVQAELYSTPSWCYDDWLSSVTAISHTLGHWAAWQRFMALFCRPFTELLPGVEMTARRVH